MTLRNQMLAFAALSLCWITVYAAEHSLNRGQTVDYGIHPRLLADAEAILMPNADFDLGRGSRQEILITGEIISKDERFSPENSIILPPKSFIRPLQKGVPVRMYLKKYQDRNAYYPIGIFKHDSAGGVK